MEADDAPLKTCRLLLLIRREEVLTTIVLAIIMPRIKWICKRYWKLLNEEARR